MFESLEERIEQDEKKDTSAKDRMMRYMAISAISILMVGGLVAASHFIK